MPSRLAIAISLILHVLAWWWWQATFNVVVSTTSTEGELTSSMTITVSPPAEKPTEPQPAEPKVEPAVEPAVDAKPVNYASAPKVVESQKPSEEVLAPDQPVEDISPTNPSEPLLSREELAEGLETDTEGIESPGYRVQGLAARLVERMVASDAACLCVFDAERVFVIDGWPGANPRLVSLASSRWKGRIAERMLRLPGDLQHELDDRLKATYGFRTLPRLRLGIATELDSQFLTRQRQAAEQVGISWEDCALTVGQFREMPGGLVFQILEVMSRSGERKRLSF